MLIARLRQKIMEAFLGTVENFEGVPGGVRGELVRTRAEEKSRRLVLVAPPNTCCRPAFPSPRSSIRCLSKRVRKG